MRRDVETNGFDGYQHARALRCSRGARKRSG
jgi:hypothetical protein